MLLAPAAYYVNWLEAHLAHVLYSENLPKGWIVNARGLRPIVGWGDVSVPFPDSHRLSVRYFAAAGQPGDKLMIDDPRRWVGDRFFTMDDQRRVVEIERDEFLRRGRTASGTQAVKGIEPDDRLAQYHLMRLGARTRVSENGTWEMVQLPGPRVGDADLAWLAGLPSLRVIILQSTAVTDEGLLRLAELPSLKKIVLERTAFSEAAVRALAERLPDCQVQRSQ